MKKNIHYIEKKLSNIDFEYLIFLSKNNMFGYKIKCNFFSKSNIVRCTIVESSDIIVYKQEVNMDNSRRSSMSSFEKVNIREEEESFSNDDLFNINSWGADLSFRELISMYEEEELIKPELQRKYVWKIDEASRLIDSILLGLPIPSIFLAKKEEKRLIIDGYQRIKTVYDYVNGVFSKNGKHFKLSNSKIINARWRGKAFVELSDDEQRRIKNTTIHAIVFEQRKPNNDSGMYQIFERINTSGRTLYPQEIRNCIYHGPYNNLLMELNKNETWRKLLNCEEEDPRMVDVENILRYFAIENIENTEDYKKNQIILKKFLNDAMSQNCNLTEEQCRKNGQEFIIIIETIYQALGNTAFNNISYKVNENGENIYSEQFVKKFHPTIYESMMLSFAFAIKKGLSFENLEKKHLDLLNDLEFREVTTSRTTKVENIKKRVSLATKYLFGEEYEWR